MRRVCFVKRYEFNFPGKISEHALVLGDINNDGENELVVGNMDGLLAVYRREHMWQTIGGHGQIASVAVGDIMNCGSNAVVVISGDGICKIYLCLKNSETGEKLQEVHNQRLPPNAKMLLLGDVQGELITDLVLGLSDRIVRIYRWLQTPRDCQLVCLYSCDCSQELGNISLSKDEHGHWLTLASQPGVSYMTMKFDRFGMRYVDITELPISVEEKPGSIESAFCTRVLGNIGPESHVALSHLEGFLYLTNRENVVLWALKIPHQPFALCKADLCMDGTDQIIAACWSGHTYFINYHGDMVTFDFNRGVQSFTAGRYAKKGNALVYSTFEEKIYIYYDVRLRGMNIYSLYAYQMQNPELSRYSKEELKELTEFCMYYYDSTTIVKEEPPTSKDSPVPDRSSFCPQPSESFPSTSSALDPTALEPVAGPSGVQRQSTSRPLDPCELSFSDPGPSRPSGESSRIPRSGSPPP